VTGVQTCALPIYVDILVLVLIIVTLDAVVKVLKFVVITSYTAVIL
jgi:hypothetical protein